MNFIESESCKSSLVAPAMALNTTLHPTAANSAGELNVRHRSEVVNKRKSIWVEVIRRHTAPLEQDGLYGVKQLTTVFSMEVKVKGQNARCLKIPRPREQSLKCLFCTFFVCVGSLDHILGLCRKFGDEFIQFGNYYRACHLCKESRNGIVEF